MPSKLPPMTAERELPVGAEALGRELRLLRDRLRAGETTREEAVETLDAASELAERLQVVEEDMLRRHDEREALLRTVLDQLPVGLVIARGDGRIEAASAYAERLLGAVEPGDTAATYPHVPAYVRGSGTELPTTEQPLTRVLATGASDGDTHF
jgi:PAS domain-containing protein